MVGWVLIFWKKRLAKVRVCSLRSQYQLHQQHPQSRAGNAQGLYLTTAPSTGIQQKLCQGVGSTA